MKTAIGARTPMYVMVALLACAGCGGRSAMDNWPRTNRAAVSPPPMGAGFVDVSAGIDAASRFAYEPQEPQMDPDQTAGVFADLDGDGKPEVIITRTGPKTSATEIYAYDAASRSLSPRTIAGVDPKWDVAAALDLDDDGYTDLVLHRPPRTIVWGSASGFAVGARFDDHGPDGGPGGLNLSDDGKSLYFDDIDGDGWIDILSGGEFHGDGNARPQLRVGLRRFQDRGDLVARTDEVSPFSVFSGTGPSGDKILALVGGGDKGATVFYRHQGDDADGAPRFSTFNPLAAGSYTVSRYPSLAAGVPMGIAAADLDGDGLLDLSMTLDPLAATFRGQATWPLVDRSDSTWFGALAGDHSLLMIPWGIAFVDLDRDGPPDAIITHGNDATSYFDPLKMIGPQWVTAHWNGGDFAFAEVTDALHLGKRGQWRGLTVGDLDRDGDVDLLVGADASLPRVYRNDIDSGNQGFALRLHGTSSNHFGIGAHVVVKAGARTQSYFNAPPAAPYSTSEPLIFVGLGKAASADTVRIEWPSGTVQEVPGIAAGGLRTVDEPPVFAIDPPSRHAPAGSGVVHLTITPRSLDGSVRAGAKVEVRVLEGSAQRAAPVSPSAGGGFTVDIAAPMTAGTARLQVTIDGNALPLKPRLWWD